MKHTGEELGQGHVIEKDPLSLLSHHHLSPEPSNTRLGGLLASGLVFIDPHLVVSIAHLKHVNDSPQSSGEKSKSFIKAHKALSLSLPTPRLTSYLCVNSAPQT